MPDLRTAYAHRAQNLNMQKADDMHRLKIKRRRSVGSRALRQQELEPSLTVNRPKPTVFLLIWLIFNRLLLRFRSSKPHCAQHSPFSRYRSHSSIMPRLLLVALMLGFVGGASARSSLAEGSLGGTEGPDFSTLQNKGESSEEIGFQIDEATRA